jgi:hypothetical protein
MAAPLSAPECGQTKRLGVNCACRHANSDTEDERTVCDTLPEILGFAPFGVHMMRIEVAGLTECNTTSASVIVRPIVIREATFTKSS